MEEEMHSDISSLRREYIQGRLRRKDLTEEPLILFERWLKEAYTRKLVDPAAMCLATVDSNGEPYQRIVLLKEYNKDGLIFYTNLSSRKAEHISNNNKVSLLFPWYQLDRQVCFFGRAKKLSLDKIKKYFYSRPKDSQIATWVSRQSEKISTRSSLEKKFCKLKKTFEKTEIPLPSFWGGYCVRFKSVEFWQGGTKRLHDRFLYQQEDDHWRISRLAP